MLPQKLSNEIWDVRLHCSQFNYPNWIAQLGSLSSQVVGEQVALR